jgi:hypothetical protein
LPDERLVLERRLLADLRLLESPERVERRDVDAERR